MRGGASDRLYHYGESEERLTFYQLLDIYQQMIYEELRIDPEDDEQTRKIFLQARAAMQKAHDDAMDIYDRHIDAAIEEMQRSENQYVSSIGRALETGDWSQVAV